MPLRVHVFSFTHNAVDLWLLLDVFTPKIRRKIFDFYISMNQKQMSLTQDLKWLLEQRSVLQLIV